MNPTACSYCARLLLRRKGREREHVVARQFFPAPQPNFITVPSCRGCNELSKKDEDYVRAIFAFSYAAEDGAGFQVYQAVCRSLSKDRGLRRAWGMGMKTRQFRTAAGLHLPPRLSNRVDISRIQNVVTKWARGLYWFERESPLGMGVPVRVLGWLESAGIPPQTPRFENLEPGSRVWPGIFEYEYFVSGEDPKLTLWSFLLWGKARFVALTG